MSEVPADDRPGDDPEPFVPSGVRRPSYPPPSEAEESFAFDDDALADALAAEMASYTSPIPVIPPLSRVAPGAGSVATDSSGAGSSEDAEPDTADEPETAAQEAIVPGGSTLEAIERLESELRRRAEGGRAPSPSSAESPASPEPPASPELPEAALFPAPPTYLRSAPPDVSASSDLPTLVEPPAFSPVESTPRSIPPDEAPAFGMPAASPADLPPPVGGAPVDFAHLPPPVGIEPAPIPPYDPSRDDTASDDTAPDDTASDDAAPDDAAPDAAAAPPPQAAAADLPSVAVPPGFVLPPPYAPPPFAPPPFAPPPFETGFVAGDESDEADDDDVVDEVDRAFGPSALAVDSTGAVTVLAPPSQPIPTSRLADGEPGLVDEVAQHHPALVVEAAGPEPTPLDLRAGRAARLFWLWFAANSSVISLSLGAVLFGLGMSLRQTLVAILVGVALSFLPLGLVTLAGKWSGQPTMIVSRATFGLTGNALPAAVAALSRVFWGGVLLWMLAVGVGRVLVDAGLDAGLGEQLWSLVALGVGFAVAFVVAIFGYGLLARLQLVLSIVTGVLVVGLIVLTVPHLDISAAQAVADGPWILVVSGVVLVFSFVGLAWVHSSADVARYQRPQGDGGSTMLWATFGATLPAFVLVAWGAMLAASDPAIADGLATNPLHTIAALLPDWYPAPLIAAIALGLLSGAVLTVYSGGFALQSLGIRLRRSGTTMIAGVLVLAAAVVLVVFVGDARGLIRDVATTIAVPVAAWAGIFATEMMIRRRFHADSLLRRGGVYPAVRWPNLVGFVVIVALGFGFTSAELIGLDWQGYLLPLFGLPEGDPLITSDIGVLVALVLGILLPLATAIPAIRRQEDASVD